MEWMESLRGAIDYMEEHLLEDGCAEGAAAAVHISPFYLQRGFKILTGYTMAEYIRCRRLYLAGLDAVAGREKVIDLADRYGYDTPESFTKAFRRFHGLSPAGLRRDPGRLRTFLPLKITISVKGGDGMDYTVEKMEGFQVIGFQREFTVDTSYQEIPKFWDEFCQKYVQPGRTAPETEAERVVWDCVVGEYGVCIDDIGGQGRFRYLIAGRYTGGPVPEGMTLYTFPDLEWAKFRCSGPLPGSLQAMNTRIFDEWLPGNGTFEIALGANIEWYSLEGEITAPDYESAVWLPVRRLERPCRGQRA